MERLLVVEHDLLVDLLVLNGWGAAARTLIVAESGYPAFLDDLAARALHENPQLPVALLHDASPRGEAMTERLIASSRFPLSGHPLQDLGLSREDAGKLRLLHHLPPPGSENLLPVDAIPYEVLATTLSVSLRRGKPLARVLRRHLRDQGD